MATKATERKVVVGVFESRDRADRAVEELRRLGFRDDQIGYAVRGTEGKADRVETGKTAAAEGLAAGAVVGGLVGAAAALLIPGVGPVIAGGVLASVLGGAAVGAAAGGVLGALIGMGVPEEEASYYEGEFRAGRTLVTVKCENRCAEAQEVMRRFGAYDVETRGTTGGTMTPGTTAGTTGTPARGAAAMSSGTDTHAHSHAHSHTGGETHTHEHGHTGEHAHGHGAGRENATKVQLREEQLTARKESVQTGEVQIGKRVVEEQRTVEVPVTREEIVIERTPVNRPADAPVGAETETVRIPIREERVEFGKQNVVREELVVQKRPVTETERRTETVRREEAVINQPHATGTSGSSGTAGATSFGTYNTWDEAMPYYRSRWQQRSGQGAQERWEDWEPRYRFGWEQANRPEYRGRSWDEVESQARKDWEANHRGTPWDRAKEGVRDAWEAVSGTRVRR